MSVPHVEAVLLLVDVVQRMADEMARGSMNTREEWIAQGLLTDAAANLRGAANNLAVCCG